MRIIAIALLVALSACSVADYTDSKSGVGFNAYSSTADAG